LSPPWSTLLNGHVIGRLEEVIAESENDNYYITEYLIGIYGWIARLATSPIARDLYRALRLAKRDCGYRVRWDQLDVSDSSNLRLLCKVEDLKRFGEQTS
jgi:hypothetical protein